MRKIFGPNDIMIYLWGPFEPASVVHRQDELKNQTMAATRLDDEPHMAS